ncbi:hypothetical protein AMATHDRAFT_65821 [Amanita thiersii Skay4041]|uniref:TATA-binding protein interacting (TIP20) domain-containing protein n=1 Tax=Amanita thiersii Skay4041 TaxID=703135 RepID=A0A2A9NCC5_9AGAR|nr:hypothetical protein AMATHDRAFT_65821 [Amanita thiersii Skay4041]
MTKAYLFNNLIDKMQSQDSDFRYMGLNDLMTEIKQDPNCFVSDEAFESKILKHVLALVEDKISEVKNQAAKCLGQMIKIVRQPQMELIIDRLVVLSGGKEGELRDISTLALKNIASELPIDTKVSSVACARLTPKLLGQLENLDAAPETIVEILAVLSILINRFPEYLSSEDIKPPPIAVLAPLLSHSRPVVRKRAIAVLAQFIPISHHTLFQQLLELHVYPFFVASAVAEKQRTTVQLIAAVTRHSPSQIGPIIFKIVPGILDAVKKDDDELTEGCLQALETLLLRCPAEITPYLGSIMQVGNQFIKYDPNYAGDNGEDEEMADADEEEEDDDLDEYSDDEDTSYRIRRAATKLINAIIGTRPELLVSIYKDVSPVLISRFGDREETVRLEVWATYILLLNQTAVYGGAPINKDGSVTRGKRKRDTEETMDVEGSPYTLLSMQVPTLSKALLNQLKSPKTPPATLQAGYNLLHTLLSVLPGSLSTQVPLVLTTTKKIIAQPPTTSTTSLYLTCLSFLILFFSSHPPPSFGDSLSGLTPVLLRSVAERHPRVSSESFRVFSALLNALRPIKNTDWTEELYQLALARLSVHDTDPEVRTAAEECTADLWICATDIMRGKGKEWEYICRTSGHTEGAVKVVMKVAKEVSVGDAWVNGCVSWLLILVRTGSKAGKADVFAALEVMLRSYSAGIPFDLPATVIPQIKPYLTAGDSQPISRAFSILTLLLELSPSITFPVVEREVLTDVYSIAHSSLLPAYGLDSLLRFIDALVHADNQIATHIVPNLVIAVEKAPKTDASPGNVAQCVAQVVKSQQAVAAGTIAEFSKNLKKSSRATSSLVVLSLLIVGELGRFIDMSPQADIFTHAIEHFSADSEAVRSAAAFAAGNIAIGNLHQFLPVIVKLVENDPKKRLLSLYALKEVVTHCSQAQLESIADLLWRPLFENSESAEENTRNVAAACLGKLATTQPSKYLPQLQERIKDKNASARATVVSAIRYTFADTSQAYDELLAPLLVDFLSLMTDPNMTVRRLALSTLNSAARAKPHLIKDHLGTLLPNLYRETVLRPELIRTVQMGPWMHKVDDGLDARKTAYETMYTLLDTCIGKIDLHEFIIRVLPGLADDSDEIKVISHMILFRLSRVAPAAVAPRLDEATPHLVQTMKGATVTKDTVKQDLERAAELQRSGLRCIAGLSKIDAGVAPRFEAFVDELKKSPVWGVEFVELIGK